MQVHVAEWPRRARVLFRSAVVTVSAAYFGLYVQSFAAAQADPLPDLVVNAVDAQGASTDVHTLAVSGTLAIEIANTGTANSGGTVDLLAFHDVNLNDRFDSGVDPILGQSTVAAPDAGTSAVQPITVAGQLPFRDAPINVWVDSAQSIVESDETNNVASSATACQAQPDITTFEPALKWEWTGSTVLPEHNQVMSVPVVAPLEDSNGDGRIDEKDIPSVVFHTYQGTTFRSDGVLRAVSGRDGHELWTVEDPAYRTNGEGSLAAADIDGDGRVEIIAPKNGGGIIAFEHDGTFKWQSAVPAEVFWGGASIADFDHDGIPEIVVGNTVLNADGSLRWQGFGFKGGTLLGPLSIVADINLDGSPEVVAGPAAYASTGQRLWHIPTLGDGFAAVANFNEDPFPEIVVVVSGRVFLLDYEGVIIWGPVSIEGGGRGGAPTIGDVDGDGKPEIGVAGALSYMVLEDDGAVKWTATIQDLSSAMTVSSMFDFDDDGRAEVVYQDEVFLRIFNGSDGTPLFQTPNTSGTTYELTVIADVDNDGHADLVVCANQLRQLLGRAPGPGNTGIRVYQDKNNSWVNTRKIWNQHSYHITSVNDDGTVPTTEQASWLTHNTYRLNRLIDRDPRGVVDLTASLLRIVDNGAGQPLNLRVRIGNGGDIASPHGVVVSFYEGDPSAGGTLIGSVDTPPIDARSFRDVSLDGITGLSGALDLFAVVDADNRVPECNETNNTVQIPGDVIARLGQIVVSTDQAIYGALTPVFLQAQVTNNGTLADVVSAALQVEDASGSLIQVFGAQDAGPLGPGESAAVNAEWNTATFAAGMYRARGLLYASDGSILSEATSSFEIRHSDTPGEIVVAALRTTTDRTLYHITDVVQVRDLVGNLSADTILSAAFLRLNILDPNGQTVLPQALDIPVADLAPGSIADITTPVGLRVATEGTFRLLGSVIDPMMNVLASDETQFTVQVDLRQALSGSVSAQRATLDVGVPQDCTFTIRNNEELISITGLEVHHSMLNLDTQQLVGDFSAQVNLDPNGESPAEERTFATDNLAAGEYACVLRAKIGETLETLASAPFTLTVPPIRIAAGIQVGARGRLLVLIDALDKNGNDGDPHGPNGAPGLTTQRALLESVISAAGWSHTIVDSADDFARELRSGGYTVYALFAEDEMLSDRMQEELREAVFRGEGLVVAGLHDTRQQELDGPLGVRIAGNAKQASIVAVQSDALGVNGDVALIPKDNALRAEPMTATSVGTYEGGEVAVTAYTYGAGRSVFAGFDLLATATRDGNASFTAELLLAAFSYVHPSAITQTAGDVVPVEIALQNEGIAAPVTISLPLPNGTALIDPGTGTFDDVTRTLNWSFALAQDERRTLEFWLQLPSGPGAVMLQARIEANGLLLAEPSTRLDVLAPQDLASIFASIDALLAGDIDAKLQQALEKSRRKLQDAEARLPDDPENALKEALKAAEALAAVDDDQATLVRVTVGLWIKWIAQQL